MKRYISKNDEKYYTHMLKILNAIGGRNLKYNWLITDMEICPSDLQNLCDLIRRDKYLIISNNELIDLLEIDDFQWIWGVFSAIPEKYSVEQILELENDFPYAEGNSSIYQDNNYIIQHPLAEIEIVAFDATLVHIVTKDDKIAELFKKLYPKANNNY